MHTKSRILGYCLLALILFLLPACGTSGPAAEGNVSPTPSSAAPTPVSTPETPPAAATKTYTTLNGDIEIPVRAEKVVSLVFVGELLALGVKPTGTGTSFLEKGLFVDELRGAEPIGDEPSVEKILELAPDLIIMHNFVPGEVIEQLSKIAPTVVMPFNDRGPVERLKMFAELLDRQEEANQFLARYEKKAAEAKALLGGVIQPGETVAYYEIWGKSFWVMSEANGRGVYNLYRTLGLQPPERVKRDVVDAGKGIDISLEVLPEYAADHMFVGVYAGDGGDLRAEDIKKTALWQSLPAVKNNHVYWVNIDEFAPSDMLALYKQLDKQIALLQAQQ